MQIYGRDFRLSDLAKAVHVVGASASPLLIRAMRQGPLAAFEFSSRAYELCHEVAEDDVIPAATLADICRAANLGQQIWMDLSQPSPEMPPGELALLCSLVKWKNPRVAVEIGTFKGFTTLHISRNTSDHCLIYTADLPPRMEGRAASTFSDPQLIAVARTTLKAFGNDPKVTQILQDSTTIEWHKILGPAIDFALIDGSHLYEHVRKDTERVLSALAPGALVMWHDYSNAEIRRGVGRYLRELRGKRWPITRLAGTAFCIYVHD